MPEKILLALSTFPDAETARRISNELVAQKFVACANILPSVESIYTWKGKIEKADETLVFFKLSEDRQTAFQEKLRSLHPYDVPEIIFVPISSGLPDYLRWVADNLERFLNSSADLARDRDEKCGRADEDDRIDRGFVSRLQTREPPWQQSVPSRDHG